MKPLVQAPNYTQVPNVILDSGHEFTSGELRVILFLCRQTFGWHRERVKASTSFIAKGTGMSDTGVFNAVKRMVAGGVIDKQPDGDSFTYSIMVQEGTNAVGRGVPTRLVGGTNAVGTQGTNAVGTNKETDKETPKERKKAIPYGPTDMAKQLVHAFKAEANGSYFEDSPKQVMAELRAATQLLKSLGTCDAVLNVARLNGAVDFPAFRGQSATLVRLQQNLSTIKARLNGNLKPNGNHQIDSKPNPRNDGVAGDPGEYARYFARKDAEEAERERMAGQVAGA